MEEKEGIDNLEKIKSNLRGELYIIEYEMRIMLIIILLINVIILILILLRKI